MKGWLVTLFGILNVILYLVVIALWISLPEQVVFNSFTSVAAIILTSGLILVNKEKFYHFYTSRFFKNFSTNLLSAFLIFVILGFINFLAFKNPILWDVSKDKFNTLTEQTRQVLGEVNEPIDFKVFARKSQFNSIRSFIELYRLENPLVRTEYIDAELNPDLISQYAISKVPAIVVEQSGKRKVAKALSELQVTNALIQVTKGKKPIVYFVKGHNELDLMDKSSSGGSYLSSLLRRSQIDIRTIDLRQIKEISNEVKTLVIWGPKSGFAKGEIDTIDQYLKRGGRLLVAIDPHFNGDPAKDLRLLLQQWGFWLENNLVVDRLKHPKGSNPTVPIISQLSTEHIITKGFKSAVFLPLASSVMPYLGSDLSQHVQILGYSSPYPASWAEYDLEKVKEGSLEFTENVDRQGPIGFFAVGDFPISKAKIVTFGNAQFLINAYEKYPNNYNLFLNSLNFLADQEELASFNNPVVEDKPIFINSTQIGIIFYFCVLFAPLILFSLAFFFFRRRRTL